MYTVPWGEDEVEILKAQYPLHGPHWAGWEALLPDRTERAIQRKAGLLGVRSEAPIVRKKRKKAQVRNIESRDTSIGVPSEDPFEKQILRMMKDGMTPQQIDKKMGWFPNRTAQILSERWKRENR